jgi:hypothetical protein
VPPLLPVQDANLSSNQVWIVSDDYISGDSLRLYNSSFAPPLGAAQPAFTILAVAPADPSYKPPRNVSHTMPSQKFTPQTRYLVLTLKEVRACAQVGVRACEKDGVEGV